METGIELIAAERKRQIEKEGWTPEHDEGHQYGDLAVHAAALAVMTTDALVVDPLGRGSLLVGEQDCDKWGLQQKHAGNEIRQLVIAGALIAAEIDRVLRTTPQIA